MDAGIGLEVADQIAVLRISRPEARNGLDWKAQERFADIVSAVEMEADVRVLIITGEGSKAFVSGGDLRELVGFSDKASGRRLNSVMSAALQKLTELPIPVIAAINGDAIGGGVEIVTACDLRMACSHARFRMAQANVGLTTGWGGTGRLVRLIGPSRALELLLTSRVIDSAEAMEIGLLHRVVSSSTPVLAAAKAWARELLQMPGEALAANKALVYATGRLAPPDLLKLESDLFIQLWGEPDHLEAMQAFLHKRPPHFKQD